MESPKIVKILMKHESDKELEELNELIKGSQNASSPPPSDEEEIEIEFSHRRQTDTASIHDFTGLPIGFKHSAVPNISPESSHLQYFSFLTADFCNIIEKNKPVFSSICCLPG
jgi:hypothetical protein